MSKGQAQSKTATKQSKSKAIKKIPTRKSCYRKKCKQKQKQKQINYPQINCLSINTSYKLHQYNCSCESNNPQGQNYYPQRKNHYPQINFCQEIICWQKSSCSKEKFIQGNSLKERCCQKRRQKSCCCYQKNIKEMRNQIFILINNNKYNFYQMLYCQCFLIGIFNKIIKKKYFIYYFFFIIQNEYIYFIYQIKKNYKQIFFQQTDEKKYILKLFINNVNIYIQKNIYIKINKRQKFIQLFYFKVKKYQKFFFFFYIQLFQIILNSFQKFSFFYFYI
ncbi:hypothetical protein IMG5_065730 [Ichthyophthirius multifiliis]|uniref:Transmembrane protein n=1 Tax=Ichthyophthirius multifiliis TaxID=5932 RepID=G0QP98_ICHMU|nr:hypothetical protein IMG5_065730 [Ichthyophthirius multifiliis]EGR32960.1 hypothetical protein IMG5_065730 [Ichthyophthirius multifiliis]|eukprot:XP_004036946.1 hypothetical protein IMG5_065730 [Ichthyophthirius multifiliis]